MEKRKLLLVAISVGIFLVIAIGAAIVFTPKNTIFPSRAGSTGPVSATGTKEPSPSYPLPVDANGPGSNTQSVSVDPVDIVRSPGDVPGLKPLPEGTVQQGSDFYINGSANPAKNPETVINVPKPSSAAVPDTPPAAKAVPAPSPRPAPAVSAPAPVVSKPAVPAKPAAQPKIHDDFWVQTGAFSTIAKAEGVKDSLASKGITSIIENRDMEGKTLFRVRVGPYTSKNEADYWLSLIKSINGFENSQVRQTQTKR